MIRLNGFMTSMMVAVAFVLVSIIPSAGVTSAQPASSGNAGLSAQEPAENVAGQESTPVENQAEQTQTTETETTETPPTETPDDPALTTPAMPSMTAPVQRPDPNAQADAAVIVQTTGVTLGEATSYKWRVGVQIQTGNQPVKNLRVTIPVPNNWPEQTVEIAEEDIPAEVRNIDYRDGDSGLKQIIADIRAISANSTVDLQVTFNVTVKPISAPTVTDGLLIPSSPPKDIRQYLGTSPGISYRNSKLRKQIKELVEEQPDAWSQVEAMYDWVRDNIQYQNLPHEDTISVYRAGQGCAEDIVGLFVAMCRSHKVPARMVWVDGHQYAEFYLEDADGAGHWFPCNVAGLRDFGGVSDPRIILQKGDDIRVPEKEDPQRYVAEHVKGSGNVKPNVRFTRDLLPN